MSPAVWFLFGAFPLSVRGLGHKVNPVALETGKQKCHFGVWTKCKVKPVSRMFPWRSQLTFNERETLGRALKVKFIKQTGCFIRDH